MLHARPDYGRIQDPDNRIPEDEPVFLIRGQDVLGPELVTQWAEKYRLLAGHDPRMASWAFEHAGRMRQWQKDHGAKVADC